MARPLRIELPGAVYHVMSRGNRRDVIVRDEHDRHRWLEWLRRVVEQYRWHLLAYCLLDNHYHLFLRTPLANLSAGMLTLNGSYTSYHNRRHSLVGHLFQGRYKAHVVEDGHHFDAISRYIHLNPVRAGLCRRADGWPWSSCPGYYRAARGAAWVSYADVLADFGGVTPQGRRRYRRFVEAGVAHPARSPFADAAHGLLVGTEAWVEKIRRWLRGGSPPQQVPVFRQVVRVPIARVADAVTALYHVPPERLAHARDTHVARPVFAYLARHVAQASLRELGPWLGLRSPAGVHDVVRRCADALARSPRLRQQVADLRNRLTRPNRKSKP